jgi:hypothetical protein
MPAPDTLTAPIKIGFQPFQAQSIQLHAKLLVITLLDDLVLGFVCHFSILLRCGGFYTQKNKKAGSLAAPSWAFRQSKGIQGSAVAGTKRQGHGQTNCER